MRSCLPPLCVDDPFLRSSPWGNSTHIVRRSTSFHWTVRGRHLQRLTNSHTSSSIVRRPSAFFETRCTSASFCSSRSYSSRLPEQYRCPYIHGYPKVSMTQDSFRGQIDVEIFRDLAERYVRPWSVCMRLLQVLDGSKEESVRTALAIDEADHLTEVESPLSLSEVRDATVREIPRLSASDAKLTACPICTWVDHETIRFALGAVHVSETIAQHQEGLESCLGC